MTAVQPVRRRNPFATRHTRPGCLAPRDAGGAALDTAALLTAARRLEAVAIEGPHGAGKTNLLTALAGELRDRDLLAGFVRLRSWRDAAVVLSMLWTARPGTTLCVDGWETVGPLASPAIRWLARGRRVGLIVTSHRPAGMATLLRCTTTPALLARLIADLPAHDGLIADDDVTQAFARHRGDVREALYDLYDRFERRARGN